MSGGSGETEVPKRAAWTALTGAAKGKAYDARWERMAEEGESVHGEADLIERLLGRTPTDSPHVRILDAGCGTGRVALELVRRGHRIVGVDRDPDLLDVARAKAPERRWHEVDLLDVGQVVESGSMDVVVMAGNVLLFSDEGTEPAIVAALGRTLHVGGLFVAGFQLRPGGLSTAAYDAMCEAAGLNLVDRWSTWDQDRFVRGGDYQVSVHRKGIKIDLGPFG